MNNNQISREISVFHGRKPPTPGLLVGYGAVIEALFLPVPVPLRLALISKSRKHSAAEGWLIFTPRYLPEESLYGHLVFALKYEGVNLLFFKKLFGRLDPEIIEEWVRAEPNGKYCRKIWFLYEWLTGKRLSVPDLASGNYVQLLDETLQFASLAGINIRRQRIRNNLPGGPGFCPLITITSKLSAYISEDLSLQTAAAMSGTNKDTLLRASAFLLLKDSKASFSIEGESPGQARLIRWGKAIGLAGSHSLEKEELLRLQKIVIEENRFIRLGYRDEGGFIGEHDRSTGEPVPEHISAKWQDIDSLMEGLFSAAEGMEKNGFHPVLAAAAVAFGFVFIHPFFDGNGRLHRYLVHHILARMNFAPQGMVFPVSASFLENIDAYRKALEIYSHPLLNFIEWRKTEDNNVEVLNETADYYRYFDATPQAEFLFDCVSDTINRIIPEEVAHIRRYDAMKSWLDGRFRMPDGMTALLIRFLEQNNGTLSRRAREKEFKELSADEIREIEENFKEKFLSSK